LLIVLSSLYFQGLTLRASAERGRRAG